MRIHRRQRIYMEFLRRAKLRSTRTKFTYSFHQKVRKFSRLKNCPGQSERQWYLTQRVLKWQERIQTGTIVRYFYECPAIQLHRRCLLLFSPWTFEPCLPWIDRTRLHCPGFWMRRFRGTRWRLCRWCRRCTWKVKFSSGIAVRFPIHWRKDRDYGVVTATFDLVSNFFNYSFIRL